MRYPSVRTLSCTALALLVGAGCSHVQYTAGSMTARGANLEHEGSSDDPPPLDFAPNEVTATTHEIALLDGTGVVCSRILTYGNAASSAAARVKKAEENRESGPLTVEYRAVSPNDFNSYPCGLYLKWGNDVAMKGFEFGDSAPGEAKFSEFGMMLEGWDAMDLVEGLYKGGGTRPSIGWYSPTQSPGSNDITLRLPFTYGLHYAPKFARGFHVRATAGFDIVTILLTLKGSPFRDSFLDPLDYNAFLGYSLSLGAGSLSARVGYNKEVAVLSKDIGGTFLVKQGSLQGQLVLALDLGQIF